MPTGRPQPRSPGGKDAKAARAEPPRIPLATNRRARHAYSIEGTLEVGLVLLGSEVRSLRNGRASIAEGYARLEGGELWLYGVHIPPLPQAASFGHDPVRRRKCLAHRRELRKWERGLAGEGTTLVPLALYFKGGRVKLELGLARGRRKGDRREREKAKEHGRTIREAMRR